MNFVEEYRDLVYVLPTVLKDKYNVDMFILDDVKNDKILKDSENLFKQFYRDAPQGYSLERLNIGFRALQGGLNYESTAKLMESSLDNKRLDVVSEALTEKRSSEEIKFLYTSDGITPNSAEQMRNIKRGYDANLDVSELKTVVNDYLIIQMTSLKIM